MSWDTAGGGDSWGASTEPAAPSGGGAAWGAEPAGDGSGGGDAYGDSGAGFRGNSGAAGGGGGGSGGGGGFSGGCFNCGEEGHNKAECPNPAVEREFTGACRLCEQQGHRAANCPSAPPKICRNCEEEGHTAFECKNPRKVVYIDVETIAAEDAWEKMKIASEERDLDDFKEATRQYLKATPDATYQQLEMAFRGQNFNVYLIAIEKELKEEFTNMDLQGNLDKKYTVSYRLTDKYQRPKEKAAWPATPEENIERLGDTGEPVDRGVPKCNNCEKLGHTFKNCPEEKTEITDRAVVKCYNCDELGHRVRDCPHPRPDKFACRNCGQSGHGAKECPEPRSAEGVTCNKCNEVGHFSKDCPQGGGGSRACRNCGEEGHMAKDCTNERKIICRNCDDEGHTSRECPKPRDYSRIQCSNCKQMGHTKVRCKEPLVEEDGGAGGGGDFNAGGGDDFGTAVVPASSTWDDTAAVDPGW